MRHVLIDSELLKHLTWNKTQSVNITSAQPKTKHPCPHTHSIRIVLSLRIHTGTYPPILLPNPLHSTRPPQEPHAMASTQCNVMHHVHSSNPSSVIQHAFIHPEISLSDRGNHGKLYGVGWVDAL